MFRTTIATLSATLLLAFSLAANAQVTVTDAWTRATIGTQKTTGVFLTITSTKDAKLVGVSSPAAKFAEVHEMKMDGNVMKMRAIEHLPLPAGKPVALEPSGYHIMLMNIAQPLKEGESVPLTLTIADPDGKTQKVDVRANVRPTTATSAK